MYYRLRDNLALRGWKYLETGIVNEHNRVTFLKPQHYGLVRMCSGFLDSDNFLFSDEQRKLLKELEEARILISSETPLPPLDEFQQYRRYDNRLISSAHWSITGKCNYKCRHCYMSAPHGLLGEMDRRQWERVIDQMAKCGVLKVSLTGGEALVHPDFWDIVDRLLENRILIDVIYSNGFLINESFFEKCADRNIKPQLSLSFDGINGAHEWLRNTKGAQKHIERALELCREHGFRNDVEFCLNRRNVGEFRENMKFLQDSGCGFAKINPLECVGEGKGLKEEALSREEVFRAFLDYLPFYKEDGISMGIMSCQTILKGNGYSLLAPKQLNKENACSYCLCGHARNSMYITSEGYVLPCIPYSENQAVQKDFGNIFTSPLAEILTDSMYFSIITTTLEDYLRKRPDCAACEHVYKCAGGCRGRAIAGLSGGIDHFEKDEENCWIFKNGWDIRLKDAFEKLGFSEK